MIISDERKSMSAFRAVVLRELMTQLWGDFLCWANIHHPKLLDLKQDPFTSISGHQGTEVCSWCGKYRRVIGDPDKKLYILPWIERTEV